jgi:hypothetical protein
VVVVEVDVPAEQAVLVEVVWSYFAQDPQQYQQQVHLQLQQMLGIMYINSLHQEQLRFKFL